MAASLETSLSVTVSNDVLFSSKTKGSLGIHTSTGCVQFAESKDFMGKHLYVDNHKGLGNSKRAKPPTYNPVSAQASICVGKAQRWWDKTLKSNMIEIRSAQEFVDSLSNAGDRLVIVDFYSPGCGGCKALHPKICQLAESNPNAIFLKVNYEELNTMCKILHVRVLPFFIFHRGAQGRLCSFSCTNATIKKFKDALAKYGTDRFGLGPSKGLDESEILSLASAGEISLSERSLFHPRREAKIDDLVQTGRLVNAAGNNIEESATLIA